MNHYIQNLIRQGEHQQLDFKHSITDSKKIARSLVAFANTDGGKLLVGVKDNGSISGVRDEEEFYMVQAAAQMYCKPPLNFESKIWEVNDKTILEITIAKSNNIVYEAPNKEGKWMVYIRVNDQNFTANKILLKVWQKKKSKNGVLVRYSEIEKQLFEYLLISQKITFSKFKKMTKISKPKAEKILINLIVLNLIEIEFTENQVYYKTSTKQQ
ncbi:MAG: ATP-dependent DNA helicase [Bacteroidetes bacterium GWF2_33_16]|nr:MAG: ATP-dependent DNA helicase [Bacteroidetes bacterium GWE2_32_14]OFY04758.1 MAG: ATP-dependent DNA helicase [Bacteroidetes bacterium GWF2_33_16]